MKKVVVCFMVCLMMLISSTACQNSSNVAEKFIGIWDCYKMGTNDPGEQDVVFKDYAARVKMEMTIEFTPDGKYVEHYYVNGKEGDKYPQTGNYVIEGEKIIFSENNNIEAEIIDGELVVSVKDSASNKSAKRYYTKR